MICALVSRAHPGLPIPAVIVAGESRSARCSAPVNGALVACIGIPPIVVTLGTLSIYRGATFLIARGAWLTSKDMTPAFLAFPKASVLGVPILIVIAVLVSLGFWVLLGHTRLGRGLYAVGGNPVAARYCGIDLSSQQFFVHTLAGAVSGLCGYLWVSRYGIAYTDIALGLRADHYRRLRDRRRVDRRRRRLGPGALARRPVPRRRRQRPAGHQRLAVLADVDLRRGHPRRRGHQRPLGRSAAASSSCTRRGASPAAERRP